MTVAFLNHPLDLVVVGVIVLLVFGSVVLRKFRG